jgi:hypothetical protein
MVLSAAERCKKWRNKMKQDVNYKMKEKERQTVIRNTIKKSKKTMKKVKLQNVLRSRRYRSRKRGGMVVDVEMNTSEHLVSHNFADSSQYSTKSTKMKAVHR